MNIPKFWAEFIQLYKENPCLWDKNSPDYTKIRLKRIAFNLLLEKYWERDETATLEKMKKKITVFRSGYAREHRKIQKEAEDPNSKYVSKLWYYPYFKFLTDNGDATALFLLSLKTDDTEMSDEDGLPKKEFFTLPELSCESENSGEDMELPVKDDDDEDVQLVHGSKWEKEDSSSNDDAEEPQSGTSTEYPYPEPVYEALPVISGVTTVIEAADTAEPSTIRAAGTTIRSVIDEAVEDNMEVEEEDDCSTFAAHIKTRMKNFDPVQKVIAQKLISDVMFMADTKQLQLSSVIVNRPESPAMNGKPGKSLGGSFAAYILDSDDESGDVPPAKRPK